MSVFSNLQNMMVRESSAKFSWTSKWLDVFSGSSFSFLGLQRQMQKQSIKMTLLSPQLKKGPLNYAVCPPQIYSFNVLEAKVYEYRLKFSLIPQARVECLRQSNGKFRNKTNIHSLFSNFLIHRVCVKMSKISQVGHCPHQNTLIPLSFNGLLSEQFFLWSTMQILSREACFREHRIAFIRILRWSNSFTKCTAFCFRTVGSNIFVIVMKPL